MIGIGQGPIEVGPPILEMIAFMNKSKIDGVDENIGCIRLQLRLHLAPWVRDEADIGVGEAEEHLILVRAGSHPPLVVVAPHPIGRHETDLGAIQPQSAD